MRPRIVSQFIVLAIGIGAVLALVATALSFDPTWRRGGRMVVLLALGSVGLAVVAYYTWCSTDIYVRCKMFPGWDL
jgi:hypothetical protein